MGLDEALDQLASEAQPRPTSSPKPGDGASARPPESADAPDRLQSALDELVSDATQLAVSHDLVAHRDAKLLRTRTLSQNPSTSASQPPRPLDAALDELAHQAFATQPDTLKP